MHTLHVNTAFGIMLQVNALTYQVITYSLSLHPANKYCVLFSQMLDQMQKFYVSNYPHHLKDRANYKLIGEMMYRRYLCIKR